MSPFYIWGPRQVPQDQISLYYISFDRVSISNIANDYEKSLAQIEVTHIHDTNPRINRLLACLSQILNLNIR